MVEDSEKDTHGRIADSILRKTQSRDGNLHLWEDEEEEGDLTTSVGVAAETTTSRDDDTNFIFFFFSFLTFLSIETQ